MMNLKLEVWEPVSMEAVSQGLILIRLGVAPDWPFEDDVLEELESLWHKVLTREGVTKDEFEEATLRLSTLDKQPNVRQALEVIRGIRAERRGRMPQQPAIEGRSMTPQLRDELLKDKPEEIRLLMRGILAEEEPSSVKSGRPIALRDILKPATQAPTEDEERKRQIIREQAEASKRAGDSDRAEMASSREQAASDRDELSRGFEELSGSTDPLSLPNAGDHQ